ncbi:hypothetical protein V6Z12_A10G280900 [Gossypium hirsutum]
MVFVLWSLSEIDKARVNLDVKAEKKTFKISILVLSFFLQGFMSQTDKKSSVNFFTDLGSYQLTALHLFVVGINMCIKNGQFKLQETINNHSTKRMKKIKYIN